MWYVENTGPEEMTPSVKGTNVVFNETLQFDELSPGNED